MTNEALEFLAVLHRTFDATRKELLANRQKVQLELDKVSYGPTLPKGCAALRFHYWGYPVGHMR